MIYFKRGAVVSLYEGFDVEKSATELCRRWDWPAVAEVTSEVVLVDGSVIDYLIADTYIDIASRPDEVTMLTYRQQSKR